MGIGKDLKNKYIEFKKDPKGQYFRHLEKMLNLNTIGNISKEDVLDYVEEWAKR